MRLVRSLAVVLGLAGVGLGLAGFVVGFGDASSRLSDLARSVFTTGTDAKAQEKPASGGRRGGGGPAAVEVAKVRSARTTNDIRAIGSLQSDESVVLAPEISGRISSIAFEEGQPVKTGDVLVKLDDALIQAEVADARARFTLADANAERARALARTGVVAGRGKDEAIANLETAQAAVALAETRLGKLELKAPFDGVAGLRSVSVGAFITAGTSIVNLEKIDQLKVDFKVPEIYLSDVAVGQEIDLSVDAIADRTFKGKIYAINPLVDVNGRALELRARLANDGMALRPGLFARITIKGLQERSVVIVPEAAIVPRGDQAFVFIIEQGKAVEKAVKLGVRRGAEVEIVEGLAADVTVVVAGQQKIRAGGAVEIVGAEGEPPVPKDASSDKPGRG